MGWQDRTRSAGATWPDAVFDVLLAAGIRQVAHVPDAGHARLIERCHDSDRMVEVRLTTEEEGVALLCGAWLGGERGVLLMQSSGVGNCVNMLGMARTCGFPLLILVTMRGEAGEFNPWQVPMGEACADVLGAMGVEVRRAPGVADIPATVAAAVDDAYPDSDSAPRAIAVLIDQRFVGFKEWKR
jgi:sulfopyruvate decarboxylase alpha subunit